MTKIKWLFEVQKSLEEHTKDMTSELDDDDLEKDQCTNIDVKSKE